MEINPERQSDRAQLARLTETPGEKGRKYESFQQWEIYQDRIKDAVINNLREQYDLQSVKEMPVVSSINLAKRLVNQCAVVYKKAPSREWSELSEDQEETTRELYAYMRTNKKMDKSNKGFKLQDQSHVWIVPDREGGLKMRVLNNHQLTVVPNKLDPERGDIYVISAMNHFDFVDQDNDFTATGYQAKTDQFETSKEFDEKSAQNRQDANKVFICWTIAISTIVRVSSCSIKSSVEFSDSYFSIITICHNIVR